MLNALAAQFGLLPEHEGGNEGGHCSRKQFFHWEVAWKWIGAWKVSEGPEQPGLFKGLICFFHLSPLGDRGGGGEGGIIVGGGGSGGREGGVNDGGGID